jgi:hypothetical protein
MAWTPTPKEREKMKDARLAFARWVHTGTEEATVVLPVHHSYPSHLPGYDGVDYAVRFVQRLADAHDAPIRRIVFELGDLAQLAVTIHFEHGQRLVLVF